MSRDGSVDRFLPRVVKTDCIHWCINVSFIEPPLEANNLIFCGISHLGTLTSPFRITIAFKIRPSAHMHSKKYHCESGFIIACIGGINIFVAHKIQCRIIAHVHVTRGFIHIENSRRIKLQYELLKTTNMVSRDVPQEYGVSIIRLTLMCDSPHEKKLKSIRQPDIHPASGFKTAFDLDLLSRGQVMLLSTFQCSHFRQISRVKVMKFTNMSLNCYYVDSHSCYSM